MLNELKHEIKRHSNKEKAKILSRFFKTKAGEYGEGEVFLGIVVPEQRKISKKYIELSLKDLQELLSSKIHEYRLISLLILIIKYEKSDDKGRKEIFDFYLMNTQSINNWDLVDLSAPKIIGNYLFDKDKSILIKLSKSENLWERRIAILSTFYFIARNKFDDSLYLAEILLYDKHDLIHKAVGWMLREIGKRSMEIEEQFLKKHHRHMPRTMLRYAIERLDDKKRDYYMGR